MRLPPLMEQRILVAQQLALFTHAQLLRRDPGSFIVRASARQDFPGFLGTLNVPNGSYWR